MQVCEEEFENFIYVWHIEGLETSKKGSYPNECSFRRCPKLQSKTFSAIPNIASIGYCLCPLSGQAIRTWMGLQESKILFKNDDFSNEAREHLIL